MDSTHYILKATLAHICSNNSNAAVHLGQEESSALWRPWVSSNREREAEAQQRLGITASNDDQNIRNKGAHGFQHPVRLYMPKSKTDEYLQHMGKKVLANFPVQATIHFYNDDTESEEEEEEDEYMDYCNYYQNVEHFPGRKIEGATQDNYSSLATKQTSQ
ncbi:protein ripply3 [Pyxicephalus adspersus]|uniref:protein ripply3 n=1 Tax=Pyxicephalus adspersus TaxID=30357 RepID=UPI003B5917B9